MLVSAGSVFAAGGVIPDGQGTNWSYGELYGQDTYYLRNFKTFNVDLGGGTNLSWSAVVSTPTTISGYGLTDAVNTNDARLTDARTPTAHDQSWSTITSTPTTVSGYGITDAVATNDPGMTNARAPLAHNQDWNTIDNTPTTISGYGLTDAVNTNDPAMTNARAPTAHDQDWSTIDNTPTTYEGYGITNIPGAADDYISTNATPQSKAGLLTLDGGLAVSDDVVITPSSTQTLSDAGELAANAASVKVQSDGGTVSVTIGNGTAEGQILLIRGMSDANKVKLTEVAPNFTMGVGDIISLTWDGAAWIEQYRRDN
ncbi:hypothetical protein ACFLQL_00035 [Verrucomicrobiota bacterium]